jgi:serine/threonine protein kinase
MIGETISHYRVIEKIGEGGMGVVYLAEHTLLGRRVAIKTISASRDRQDQHFRSRFLREAQAVSKLSHPNIATVYDYGETDGGQPYIVMELIEGQTLAELMRAEALTIARSIEIIKQVADALGEAHRHGIVHRDIKPSNIALNMRGVVKVLDFGLAKQIVSASPVSTELRQPAAMPTQTREDVRIGTPLYMSPEQVLGVAVDARSDLFSVGSVLYESIAGRPAFAGQSDIEIYAKIIRDDPPPPSDFNPVIPEALNRVVRKALAKKSDERYQTAADLIVDLASTRADITAFDSNQPVKSIAARISRTQRLSALSTLSDILNRPRLSIGYVSVFAFALLVILAGALYVRRRPYQPSDEAKQWYDEGTRALQDGTYYKASKMMEQAIGRDKSFALAHARLAESWSELGYIDRATSELSVANLLVSNSSLSSVDALYLQAINATVSHDFKRAVESYREMISKVSAAELPYAYVELGRAYEKNEDLSNAIANYQHAIAKDSRYASAFLRSGILKTRLEDFSGAEDALDQAFDLFRLQSNPEGMAEVLIQRGILIRTEGDAAKAREPLQQALQIVQTFTNPSQETNTLLQLAALSRLTGDNEAAEKYAKQAKQISAANALNDLYAQSILEIGYVHFYRSEIQEAKNLFQEALARAQADKSRVTEARAQLALGGIHIQQDDADAGIPFIKQALAFFEPNIYRKEIMLAQLYLAQAYSLKGQNDEARAASESALGEAKVLNDQEKMSVAHKNIGTLLAHQEKYSEALDHINKAYSIYNALTKKIDAAYALVSKAEMEWRLGDYDAAASDLSLASSYAEQQGTKFQQIWGRMYVASSPMKLSRGDFRGAISDAQKAIKADTSRTQHPAIEAQSTLGLAQFRSGNKEVGKRTCEATVKMAREAGDPRLLGAALLALAEILVESRDGQNALAAANEASGLFEKGDQLDSLWRAQLMAGRAHQILGDYQTARAEFLKADNLFTGLEQRFGPENYRRYQDRTDVVAYRKQLMTASAAERY